MQSTENKNGKENIYIHWLREQTLNNIPNGFEKTKLLSSLILGYSK